MSAAENSILSADDYVQEMLRAAEAQFDGVGTVAALNRRAFRAIRATWCAVCPAWPRSVL